MPLVYQQNINAVTKLGVWHIAEEEDFFLEAVPLQRDITHPHKRLQHLAGRYLLQELYPDFPVSLIRIADTRKPFLPDEDYHFSISHCGDYAAVIVSKENRVGVDIEMMSDKIGRIVPKFLTADEQQLLLPGNIGKTATLCWSAKESIFKWYGTGQVDFRQHINIQSITGDDEGKIDILFSKEQPAALTVHYLFFNAVFLSWVVT